VRRLDAAFVRRKLMAALSRANTTAKSQGGVKPPHSKALRAASKPIYHACGARQQTE